MSSIASNSEDLILNADGGSSTVKFKIDGTEKASISSAGLFTSTTIDATKLTGTIPNFTSTGIDDNADATAITIDSSENVGINNSAPTQRLEINGNSQLNAHDNPSGSGGYFTTKGMQIGNAFDAGLSGGDDDRNAIVWNERGTSLLLGTNNIERMRIDYNGNVGIGVTPEGWHSNYKALQIGNTGTLFKDNVNGGDFSIGNNFYLNSTPAYAYTTTAEASRHSQENGIHYFQVAASGSADSAITWTDCLKVWNNSATGPGFTVGTHNTNGSDKGYSCHIENNIIGHRNTAKLTDQQTHWRFYNPNGQVGNINTSGSGTNYVTSSDYRLKENINYDWDATTRLKQLKPARFNFIADDTNTLVDGFIAHEVSSVVPEAISGAKDAVDANGDIDPQGIDQSKLVPLLVKTIQELEARITTLEG